MSNIDEVLKIYSPYVSCFKGEIKEVVPREYYFSKMSNSKYKKASLLPNLQGYELNISQDGKFGLFDTSFHFPSSLQGIPFSPGNRLELFVLQFDFKSKTELEKEKISNFGVYIPSSTFSARICDDFFNSSTLIHSDNSNVLKKRNLRKGKEGIFGLKLGNSQYTSDYGNFLPELRNGRNNFKEIYQGLVKAKVEL
jgi:hypothetical protein